jgi:hypothetical protein
MPASSMEDNVSADRSQFALAIVALFVALSAFIAKSVSRRGAHNEVIA